MVVILIALFAVNSYAFDLPTMNGIMDSAKNGTLSMESTTGMRFYDDAHSTVKGNDLRYQEMKFCYGMGSLSPCVVGGLQLDESDWKITGKDWAFETTYNINDNTEIKGFIIKQSYPGDDLYTTYTGFEIVVKKDLFGN